jgi:hypothetical protein
MIGGEEASMKGGNKGKYLLGMRLIGVLEGPGRF